MVKVTSQTIPLSEQTVHLKLFLFKSIASDYNSTPQN